MTINWRCLLSHHWRCSPSEHDPKQSKREWRPGFFDPETEYEYVHAYCARCQRTKWFRNTWGSMDWDVTRQRPS
jgi:hypothetical protein